MIHKKTIDKTIGYIGKNLYGKMSVADVSKTASYSYIPFHCYFYVFTGELIDNYIRGRHPRMLLELSNKMI